LVVLDWIALATNSAKQLETRILPCFDNLTHALEHIEQVGDAMQALADGAANRGPIHLRLDEAALRMQRLASLMAEFAQSPAADATPHRDAFCGSNTDKPKSDSSMSPHSR
jgi:hypothetical protein